jgi:hypothetical protein
MAATDGNACVVNGIFFISAMKIQNLQGTHAENMRIPVLIIESL